MAADDREKRQVPQLVLLAAVTFLAAVSGVASLARQADRFGPQVGDLVAFNPTNPSPFDSTARLTADRLEKPPCVLDLSVLQRSGGSLVVEQRGSAPKDPYRLHWAGPRTSADAADCGGDADLLLSRQDMSALAMAASGSGVDTAATLRLR